MIAPRLLEFGLLASASTHASLLWLDLSVAAPFFVESCTISLSVLGCTRRGPLMFECGLVVSPLSWCHMLPRLLRGLLPPSLLPLALRS